MLSPSLSLSLSLPLSLSRGHSLRERALLCPSSTSSSRFPQRGRRERERRREKRKRKRKGKTVSEQRSILSVYFSNFAHSFSFVQFPLSRSLSSPGSCASREGRRLRVAQRALRSLPNLSAAWAQPRKRPRCCCCFRCSLPSSSRSCRRDLQWSPPLPPRPLLASWPRGKWFWLFSRRRK